MIAVTERVLQSWVTLRAFARGISRELEEERLGLRRAQSWFHECRKNNDNNLWAAREALYQSLDRVWRAQQLANDFFDQLVELKLVFRINRQADGSLIVYPEQGQRKRPITVRL